MTITEEFEYIGKRLFNEGLVGGNFGNMSVRTDGGFYITKSGSYLDECEEVKFVSDDGVPEAGASSEWRVHYAVYKQRPDVNYREHGSCGLGKEFFGAPASASEQIVCGVVQFFKRHFKNGIWKSGISLCGV